MNIRHARPEDVPAMLDIYNHAITHTTATFDLQEQTLEERLNWFHKHNERYPLLVAVENDKLLGYCGILPFRSKPAYNQTVELSIYVHPQARGKGIGKKLMQEMIVLARRLGYHAIIAGITGGNEASIKLHEQFGFTCAGIFREVGYKFGAWQDVHFYQLLLNNTKK